MPNTIPSTPVSPRLEQESFSNMSNSSITGWKAYEYYPSLGAAVLFILLFLTITILHTFHLFRTRTWFFIPMVIGGYFETVGYIGRAMSAKQSPNWTTGPYIIQSTLLLIAPALFAASIYMELGRIILLVKGQSFSLVPIKWTTSIFVGGDVLSFLMQASGAGLMVSGSSGDGSSAKTGQNVIIGGLFVQIIFFGFFLISALVFQRRLVSNPSALLAADALPWRKHMFALHTSSVLILIRSVVRVVEYVQGTGGFLMKNEVFIYVFDGLLMWVMMVIFAVIHPSEVNVLLGRSRKMTRGFGLGVVDMVPLVNRA
ncbi:RTA-like protein [Penicillium argentinense]|uniref:RTA-like protein n=1 Tax=Penicillium argentinense TaxID=1131581 RepID=A0A9W9KL61_9EURO|nr:RTA-like protein [Penicillium argentinense]KAJ5109711.1 RTA-like protein [Penicillium argentinense]